MGDLIHIVRALCAERILSLCLRLMPGDEKVRLAHALGMYSDGLEEWIRERNNMKRILKNATENNPE